MKDAGRMRAAVLKEFRRPLVIEEQEIPTPAPDEVLVKVMASGLCLTDVHIQEGIIGTVRLPYTPGHEMAGIVCELGEAVPEQRLRVGQHVVCGIDITCGECALCRIGRRNLCRQRVRIGFERNGSHAEYAVVPYANLFPIDDRVPFDQAAIIPDAVACMLHAIADQGRIQPGDRVLIYGCGALGLQAVQIAKRFGAKVFAAARTQAKLDMALELGADAGINTARKNLTAELERLTGGEMMDSVFDLVGNEDTLDMLLRCIRPGGKIVALAYAFDRFWINCQETVIKEKEIIGVRGSTQQNLLDSIRMVERGEIVPVVTRHFRLEEINEALAFLRESKGLGRSVLTFE